MTLEEASRAKLERICDKLDLGPATTCWRSAPAGAASRVHAAATRGCRVTTTTISREQHELARRARARGRARGPRDGAARGLPRAARARYDKLVSIEMIEAVGWKDFGTFFARCAALLRPDGLRVEPVGLASMRLSTSPARRARGLQRAEHRVDVAQAVGVALRRSARRVRPGVFSVGDGLVEHVEDAERRRRRRELELVAGRPACR